MFNIPSILSLYSYYKLYLPLHFTDPLSTRICSSKDGHQLNIFSLRVSLQIIYLYSYTSVRDFNVLAYALKKRGNSAHQTDAQ